MPLSAPTTPDPTTAHTIRLRDGISESVSPNGPKATVIYRCAWTDRYDLARELVGGYGPDATGFSGFTPPHKYPPSPNMFCREVSSIRGLGCKKRGTGSKWLPYKIAELTAVYETLTYDVSTPTAAGQIDPTQPILFCRQRIRSSSQFVILPKRKLKYSISGTIVETEVGRPAVQKEVTLEFPRVPFNPSTVIQPYQGLISDRPMFGCPAGAVLLDSHDTDDSASSDGSLDHAVTLTYLCMDHDWNKLLNDVGDWELIEYDIDPAPAEPKRPFEYVNHFDLFK